MIRGEARLARLSAKLCVTRNASPRGNPHECLISERRAESLAARGSPRGLVAKSKHTAQQSHAQHDEAETKRTCKSGAMTNVNYEGPATCHATHEHSTHASRGRAQSVRVDLTDRLRNRGCRCCRTSQVPTPLPQPPHSHHHRPAPRSTRLRGQSTSQPRSRRARAGSRWS